MFLKLRTNGRKQLVYAGVPYLFNSPPKCSYLLGSAHGSTGTPNSMICLQVAAMHQLPKASFWQLCPTMPHTSFAYHTWHVQLTSKILQCQETSGTKFSNAMCLQIVPFVPQHIKIPSEITQALIKSWVPRIHTAPSANGRGELHIQLFLGWWSTMEHPNPGCSRKISNLGKHPWKIVEMCSVCQACHFQQRKHQGYSPEFNHLDLSSNSTVE